MSSQTHASYRSLRVLPVLLGLLGLGLTTGCQDGPLYALKVANPYYSLGEWRRDEAMGITDHQRRKQLAVLAETAHQLDPEQQKHWVEQLDRLMQNDRSAEMRRLAVRAAGRMESGEASQLIERGLDDESVKVRMEACGALAQRQDEVSARLLIATLGTETNQDVKHSAMEALASYESPMAVDALKRTLGDRNPATRDLAMQSLRDSTGKDYGDDPQVWIAALNGEDVEEAPTRLADRVRNFF